jgi:YHS domain-containing protein
MKKSFFPLLFMLALLAFSQSAQGQNVFVDKNQVALSGYDATSYFSGKPTKGQATYSAEYQGATYHFANAANRDAFKANQGKYAPQYGGWCAYGWSKGYPAKTDPEAWSIIDGKLYLNYNAQVKKTWDQDTQGYIVKADENWSKKQKQ